MNSAKGRKPRDPNPYPPRLRSVANEWDYWRSNGKWLKRQAKLFLCFPLSACIVLNSPIPQATVLPWRNLNAWLSNLSLTTQASGIQSPASTCFHFQTLHICYFPVGRILLESRLLSLHFIGKLGDSDGLEQAVFLHFPVWNMAGLGSFLGLIIFMMFWSKHQIDEKLP